MKKRKYGNKSFVMNGERFDSKREYEHWVYLQNLQAAGMISDLDRQVAFELIPAVYEDDVIGPRGGVHRGRCIERGVKYIADFVYKDEEGNLVVEDTKSKPTTTPEYIIKRKLMLHFHKIQIKEV